MQLPGVQSLRSDRPSLPKQVRTPGGSSSRSARQVARRRIPGVCRNSDSRSQSTPHGPDRAASRAATSEARKILSTNSRSEEHTSELQSLMRISYAVFCLKKKKQKKRQ